MTQITRTKIRVICRICGLFKYSNQLNMEGVGKLVDKSQAFEPAQRRSFTRESGRITRDVDNPFRVHLRNSSRDLESCSCPGWVEDYHIGFQVEGGIDFPLNEPDLPRLIGRRVLPCLPNRGP